MLCTKCYCHYIVHAYGRLCRTQTQLNVYIMFIWYFLPLYSSDDSKYILCPSSVTSTNSLTHSHIYTTNIFSAHPVWHQSIHWHIPTSTQQIYSLPIQCDINQFTDIFPHLHSKYILCPSSVTSTNSLTYSHIYTANIFSAHPVWHQPIHWHIPTSTQQIYSLPIQCDINQFTDTFPHLHNKYILCPSSVTSTNSLTHSHIYTTNILSAHSVWHQPIHWHIPTSTQQIYSLPIQCDINQFTDTFPHLHSKYILCPSSVTSINSLTHSHIYTTNIFSAHPVWHQSIHWHIPTSTQQIYSLPIQCDINQFTDTFPHLHNKYILCPSSVTSTNSLTHSHTYTTNIFSAHPVWHQSIHWHIPTSTQQIYSLPIQCDINQFTDTFPHLHNKYILCPSSVTSTNSLTHSHIYTTNIFSAHPVWHQPIHWHIPTSTQQIYSLPIQCDINQFTDTFPHIHSKYILCPSSVTSINSLTHSHIYTTNIFSAHPVWHQPISPTHSHIYTTNIFSAHPVWHQPISPTHSHIYTTNIFSAHPVWHQPIHRHIPTSTQQIYSLPIQCDINQFTDTFLHLHNNYILCPSSVTSTNFTDTFPHLHNKYILCPSSVTSTNFTDTFPHLHNKYILCPSSVTSTNSPTHSHIYTTIIFSAHPVWHQSIHWHIPTSTEYT